MREDKLMGKKRKEMGMCVRVRAREGDMNACESKGEVGMRGSKGQDR